MCRLAARKSISPGAFTEIEAIVEIPAGGGGCHKMTSNSTIFLPPTGGDGTHIKRRLLRGVVVTSGSGERKPIADLW